jgi:predicted nucleotidyltransferase
MTESERGGAVVARQAHNLEAAGSTPGPAIEQLTIDKRLPVWARRVVMSGMCGSHVHGTFIPSTDKHGTDDVDVFQIIAHPKKHYLGLPYYRRSQEAYQTHGESLDIVVHELAKYVYLCSQGNPNVNTYLWLEPVEYFSITPPGDLLLAHREVFLSRRMFVAFGGYAYAQLKKMVAGVRLGYMGEKRKQLMGEYGYDIKNAAHCIRLFITGIRLAKENRLVVKLQGDELERVLSVKRGEHSAAAVERMAMELDAEFRAARASSILPEQASPEAVDRLLRHALESHWDSLLGSE